MKASILLLMFVVTVPVLGQSVTREFGLGYTYMAPMGPMRDNIRQGHGINLDFYLTPGKKRLAYGLEFTYIEYGNHFSRQLYTFDNGTTAPMNINVYNMVSSLMAGTRYYLRPDGLLKPFVSGKLGYAWFTTDLSIYDPNAFDDCEPIDNVILLRDGTFIFSPGGGLQFDLVGLFKKLPQNKLIFTANVNLVLGGHIRYMNADAPNHHQPSGTDVNARFINTQTQVVHDHHVGNVYQSYLEMMDIRGGIILRWN